MSKTRKFYRLNGMLRAGPVLHVIRAPFTIASFAGTDGPTIVARSNVCALTRDGTAWPKDVARLTAGQKLQDMIIWQCDPERDHQLVEELKERSTFKWPIAPLEATPGAGWDGFRGQWPEPVAPPPSVEPGVEEGDTCNREGCTGRMEYREVENCSCHISPPCHACTTVPLHCPACDWEE